jgi:uncharacterized protein (DUF849 family)
MHPVVIEVALNGATPAERNPTVPRSIDDIIEQGVACMDAGASIVHTHLPVHNTEAALAGEQYDTIFQAWLDHDANALAMPTIGFGAGVEDKLAHLDYLAGTGAIRIGFIDPGTILLGYVEPDGTPSPNSPVYVNTFADMNYAIDQCNRHGLALHFALFEPGFLRNDLTYWRLGRLTPGSFVKFYFGGPYGVIARGKGVTFGLPPTVKALDAYLEMLELENCDLPWFSAVVGGDLIDTPVARATIERGGHIRVGLEDHASDRRRPSNLELVNEVVALCHDVGRAVATPEQTVEVLGMRPRQSAA